MKGWVEGIRAPFLRGGGKPGKPIYPGTGNIPLFVGVEGDSMGTILEWARLAYLGLTVELG